MIDYLKQISKNNWIDAIYWFLLSSLGGLLPIWGLLLILIISSKQPALEMFTNNGELALYSASIISASLYSITKDYFPPKTRNNNSKLIKIAFPSQAVFVFICILILISTILFAAVSSFNLSGLGEQINKKFILNSSIFIAIFTIIFSYFITVIDNSLMTKSDEEIKNYFTESQNQLEKDFNAILEKENEG